jgi:hypothetical protein
MRYEDHLERVAAWSHKVKQRPSAGETASLLDAIRQKRM